MIDYYILKKEQVTKVSKYSKNTKKIQWIDIVTDDKKEILDLADNFPIHLLTLEDCTTKMRSKIEPHTHYLFIITKYIDQNHKRLQNNFILINNTLITIRSQELAYIDNLKKHESLLENIMKKGILFLLHELLDRQVDLLFPIIDKIENKAAALENKAHISNDVNLMQKLFTFKNELTLIQKTVRPLIEITAILKEKTKNYTSEESKIYFQDLHDHTLLISNEINHTRETILSTINMILAFNSDKMNQNMKILTIVTTILMPLTLITGIYGMNFRYMPEIPYKYGYPITLFVMLAIGVIMLLVFKKYKWL